MKKLTIDQVMNNIKERVNFRTALEKGILLIPTELQQYVDKEPLIKAFWHSLWNNFLNHDKPISTTYWYDKVDSIVLFNKMLQTLSLIGWIDSIVLQQRHWAEVHLKLDKVLEYITENTLLDIRKEVKFNRYKLLNNPATNPNITKQNGKKRDTGLVREGFMRSGNIQFKYDTDKLYKYFDAIVMNVTKSMRLYDLENNTDSTIDEASYASIAKEIVEYHMYSPDEKFTLGENYNDSRGRAISTALQRVFNPITFKDARALLLFDKPQLITNMDNYLKAMYLFVAELHGVKRIKSENAKLLRGMHLYKKRELPNLDLNTEEGRKDLNELIYLERIYEELDVVLSIAKGPKYTYFPIELDASASMLQIESVLLNHKPFMEMTNVLGREINDPWYIKDVTRLQVKFHATPTLYGSSQTADTLWKKNNQPFNKKQVATMNYEVQKGQFAVANAFKDLLIEHVRPLETMEVTCWKDTFTIECNRFRNVGEYTKRYPLYSTEEQQIVPIVHTHTKKVPDLKQFKRYFPTLLIHNIDSKIADTICLNKSIDWIISIHDAFLVSAVNACIVRKQYASLMKELHKDHKKVINKFFKSIRLSRNAQKDWDNLQELIEPLTKPFKCNDMALK